MRHLGGSEKNKFRLLFSFKSVIAKLHPQIWRFIRPRCCFFDSFRVFYTTALVLIRTLFDYFLGFPQFVSGAK